METSPIHPQNQEASNHESKEPILEKRWKAMPLTRYHGFWFSPKYILGTEACHHHFTPLQTDIVLASMPKSGTTWLKALSFSLVTRSVYNNALHDHPLLSTNPHDLVPLLESELYRDGKVCEINNFNFLCPRRLFSSHLPYTLLPKSILESKCQIVYICRNPKDTFVSMWHFLNKRLQADVAPISIPDVFDLFCEGTSPVGPFWDHVLSYWKASLERPEMVLFIKYEEMKEEPMCQLRRLAEFLGCPFSEDEERRGVVEEISKLCSFDNMKNLEVNRSGRVKLGPECKDFFRRGEVGDYENYLTAEMSQRLDQVTQHRLQDSGLTFTDVLNISSS